MKQSTGLIRLLNNKFLTELIRILRLITYFMSNQSIEISNAIIKMFRKYSRNYLDETKVL